MAGLLAPMHGIVAEIAGAERQLVIRHQEVERWEQMHSKGILAFIHGSFGHGGTTTSREEKDFLILGLVGAGMGEREAAELINTLPVTKYIEEIVFACRELVLVTFYSPEPADDGEAEDTGEEKKSTE